MTTTKRVPKLGEIWTAADDTPHTYADGLADGVAQVMDWYSEWSPEDAYPTFPDYVERRCERAGIDCWWFRAETAGES